MPLPNMSTTLNGWELPITLRKRTQSIVDGLLVANYENITFKGVVQPLKNEDLQFKPENLRSFEWLWIHAKATNLNLETADEVVYNDRLFRVMQVKDYSPYGFIEYQLCKAYDEQSS